MKKILILLLFPISCIAQKFEVSEMAGYGSFTTKSEVNFAKSKYTGFCNHASIGIYLSNHFTVGLQTENITWEKRINDYGVYGDFHYKFLLVGIDVLYMPATSWTDNFDYYSVNIKYAGSMVYGAHIGAQVKIVKRLYAKIQIGEKYQNLNEKQTEYQTHNTPGVTPLTTRYFNYQVNYFFLNAIAGLSYKFK